ncbi:MAG: hypothetical protein ABI846_11510 [Rudaea sp.]
MKAPRAIVFGLALAFVALRAPAAAEKRPDDDTVHTLVSLGCGKIPEQGPRAMNCGSDAGYFLCTVFEKLGKPVECSGAATPAIRDLAKLSDDHFLHADVPRIAKATPCVIWAYPEDDAVKLVASRRCAMQVLRTLHCKTTPASDSDALELADAKFSATCQAPQQHTCGSLLEAGFVDRCAP